MAIVQNLIATFVSLVITVSFLLILEELLESANQRTILPKRNVSVRDYIISARCSGAIVMLVTSYEGHIELRSAIRRTISEQQLQNLAIRRVFLLGRAYEQDKSTVTQAAVQDEANKFNDILQGDFRDTYRNLTRKNLMGLQWAYENCPNAKLIIKIDDDIVIDFYKIINGVQNLTLNNSLMGYLYRDMTPKRDPSNKWYVTTAEYSESTYPPYLSGWFYITTPHVAEKLVTASQKIPHFWIEDIYITGILARAVEVQHVDVKDWFTADYAFVKCCIQDYIRYGYDCDFVVGPNGGDNKLIWKFNKAMKKCRNGGCKSRPLGKGTKETCVIEFKEQLKNNGSAWIENYKLS